MNGTRVRLTLLWFCLFGVLVAQPPERAVWDSLKKSVVLRNGEKRAVVHFELSNPGSVPLQVTKMDPSCGCTLVQGGPLPWIVGAEQSKDVEIDIDVTEKTGTLTKTVGVTSSAGLQVLTISIEIPMTADMEIRLANRKAAAVDRQAVFKIESCARCHASGLEKLKGKDLFAAACGICHEGPNRSTMVPDLREAAIIFPSIDWERWINNGKPNTLMPAFAQASGGPLTPEQVSDVAEYCRKAFRHR